MLAVVINHDRSVETQPGPVIAVESEVVVTLLRNLKIALDRAANRSTYPQGTTAPVP